MAEGPINPQTEQIGAVKMSKPITQESKCLHPACAICHDPKAQYPCKCGNPAAYGLFVSLENTCSPVSA